MVGHRKVLGELPMSQGCNSQCLEVEGASLSYQVELGVGMLYTFSKTFYLLDHEMLAQMGTKAQAQPKQDTVDIKKGSVLKHEVHSHHHVEWSIHIVLGQKDDLLCCVRHHVMG